LKLTCGFVSLRRFNIFDIMKKTFAILCCSGLLFAACQNQESSVDNHDDHAHEMAQTEGETSAFADPHTDPVCDMSEMSERFTEFSVVEGDTTWFCSPHCKEVFDKDPAKYAAK